MSLPEWAEDVLRSCAPQPAFGQALPAPEALEQYQALTQPIRYRWRELEHDVWPRFTAPVGLREQQARCLLQLMIDSAKYRKPDVFKRQRAAIAELHKIDDELRQAFKSIAARLARRDRIEREHHVDSGFAVELMPLLQGLFAWPEFEAWRHVHESAIGDVLEATSSQRRPRLADLIDEIVSTSGTHAAGSRDLTDRAALAIRKQVNDARRSLVYRIDDARNLLAPVELTAEALATIANVLFDSDGQPPYTARAVAAARGQRIHNES